MNPVSDRFLHERYENFYYGKYAGDIQQYDDLHVYRGDRENLDGTELMAAPVAVRPLEDIQHSWADTPVGSSFG